MKGRENETVRIKISEEVHEDAYRLFMTFIRRNF